MKGTWEEYTSNTLFNFVDHRITCLDCKETILAETPKERIEFGEKHEQCRTRELIETSCGNAID